MKLLFLGFCLFCCLSSSLGKSLFPFNKLLTYKWDAHITSGSVFPVVLNSSWTLEAKINICQDDSNTTLFKISQINEDNGQINIAPLELPFYATFIDGELQDFEIHENDEVWSVNMKRALLNLFQLNTDSVNTQALSDKEVGLYGQCNVEYSSSKIDSQMLKIRKNVDHDSCSNLPFDYYANCPLMMCSSNFQKIVSSHSEREYIVYNNNSNGNIMIHNISAVGRILVQPFQARAEAHYSTTRQIISIESTTNLNESLQKDTNVKSATIVYQLPELDPTYGKEPSNKSELVKEIYTLLGELSDSLSAWEVGVKGLDNQTSFYILDHMWWLRVEDWETLYTAVTLGTSYRQETIQHLFWDLVPQVGSKSTVLFIIQLVTTGRLKGFLASRLLVNFPFYLRETSEELLAECEVFLKLGDKISNEVKHSAVLSFASIIHRTCKINCKRDTLDRYAKLYLDKFTGNYTYEDKMLYLQGLNNMELDQVLDFLTPVISSSTNADKNIRFLAVWATVHCVYTNPNKVYEVYWPIFTNKSESLELRVASLSLLIMSKPTTSRFLSLYWFMQGEPSEQLYNFYYTTIHSLANTNYPCYSILATAANKISRFVPPKSRQWATGNYILDYEDPDRAYGGLFQVLLIASEHTGLPNVFMFVVDQHSLGHSRIYALYLKVEGLAAELCNEFDKISNLVKEDDKISKVFQLLNELKVPLNSPEGLHLELTLKIDGKTILSQYLNKTSFSNLTEVTKKLSSLYFEFSINYQSLHFPLLISTTQPSDIGAPALIQVRTASLISARGSVSQENEGRARNAKLDLRYSWNGVSTLKMYNPLGNKWHGADRCRNLHIRLPFATQLILEMAKSVFKVTAVRHRDFVTGSRLGLVWHASSRVVTQKPILKMYPNISDEWTMDSEDLGARLGASVFDCPHPDTLPDALQLLKKAFLANHKNYNMIPGGVVILGLLSLKDHLHFQPQGSNCGVMLYFTPLLTQVEPVLLAQGNHMKLSMTRQDGLLWEIQAGSKRLNDGNKEFAFKLYRAPSVSVTVAHIWRVRQLEGAFIVPSRMSGVFHPPSALTGYAFVSWGNAAPSDSDKAAMLDLKVMPGHNETNGGVYCEGFTPECLQAGSDLATRQIATLQYANLPLWLKTAAHALFPEHIQTESTRTQITFDYPVSFLPWNTKGLCALNQDTVLTLDNTTLPTTVPSCYALAVADCSRNASFSIEVKRMGNLIGTRIYSGLNEITLEPSISKNMAIIVNGNKVTNSSYNHVKNHSNELSLRERTGGIKELELRSGVVLLHYNTTVVVLIPAVFRGYTCGLCGNFNGDSINEPSLLYSHCNSNV